jgi:hypothetical protein
VVKNSSVAEDFDREEGKGSVMKERAMRAWLQKAGWLACAGWLVFAINREILQSDSGRFGFRAPGVAAGMKNCTSDDPRQRYACTEHAILAGQRSEIAGALEGGAVIFGPPLLFGLLGWLALRDSRGKRPASIKRWRVR